MTLAQLFKRILPYMKPHRFLLAATLSLTQDGIIGSCRIARPAGFHGFR